MSFYTCKLCGAQLPENKSGNVRCEFCDQMNYIPVYMHTDTANGQPEQPERDTQPYIFASYAHKDNDTVLPIIHAMQKDGFRVWYDDGIEAGTEWPAFIEKMVLGCTVFIVFLSDNTIESANCRKEINLAAECGKKVLVLQMDEQIDYKEYGMRLQLNTYQKLYVCRFAERKKLLAALHEASILHSCKTVGVPEPTAEPIAPVQQDSDRVKALVKRAFLFLEDGEREKADEYCERALDMDPEYAPAYVVKTMLALGYTDIKQFETCTEKLATHPAFSKALRFADELYRTTLKHMIDQSAYNRAVMLMQKGDMMSLCEAITEFQSIEDKFADAKDLRAQCQQKLDALTEQAKRSSAQQTSMKVPTAPGKCKDVVRSDADDTYENVPDQKDADGLYRVHVSIGNASTPKTVTPSANSRPIADIRREFSRNQGIIACGETHTVGLKADGTVLTVGEKIERIENVQNRTNIVAVSSGYAHIVGLRANGTVCNTKTGPWGDDSTKQWKNIVSLACTHSGTVGLKNDGTVVYSGYEKRLCREVQNWSKITAITAGRDHIAGLTKDGKVIAAGEKTSMPQCNTDRWKNMIAVAAGSHFTAGLQADGKVIVVGDLIHVCKGKNCVTLPWTDIVAIAAGNLHLVGLRADGTVVAAGNDLYHRCNVQDWTDIVAIAGGGSQTVGVKADGTVVAVGKNKHGQCDVSDWKLF